MEGNRRLNGHQESPHEHQQNLLLSRIITNVVRLTVAAQRQATDLMGQQEKLNEAVIELNKSLQVTHAP